MMDDPKFVLKVRLDKNYQDFLDRLQKKTLAEIITMAPEITAAQQCREELSDACDPDDVAFLLQFDDPLEVVRGYWEAELTGYDHRNEMGRMLWEIRDREQLAPPPAAAEPKTPSRSKRGQKER